MAEKSLGPFLGLNNRLPDTALHVDKKGDYLSVADNIDINNAGEIGRREAEVLLEPLSGAHSLQDAGGGEVYFVQSGKLYKSPVVSFYATEIFDLWSNDPVNWCEIGTDLYFSNGSISGRISAGVIYPIGLQAPSAPVCTVIAGTMPAGKYQVALSYCNTATLEEGCASFRTNITLDSAGGLAIPLPAATDGATHVNVYVSVANGSTPMLAATIALGVPSVDLSATPVTTREASIRIEAPLPGGALFASNGKLCSFYGDMVYVGTPFRPGYYDTVAGYIQFRSDVTIAIENQGGTYIATETETHWFPGDLNDVQETISDPLPFGGVPGTAFRHPTLPTVGWFSDNGFILGDRAGAAESVTDSVLDPIVPASGVSNIRWSNGYVRVFSCGYCLNLESMAVTQYLDYDFNSFSGDVGLKADGLYSLSGSVTGVDAKACFGRHSFGTDALKHMPTTYLGVDSVEPMLLQIETPDHDYTYSARSSGSDLRITRVDSGKGLRANWFKLTLHNQDGEDFTLSTVSFLPIVSSRRI